MSAAEQVLLTWCAPWVIAVPIAAVTRMVDLRPPGVCRDLAELLDLPRSAEAGAWLLIDRETPLALRVDRCLQLTTPSALRPVPPGLRQRDLPLQVFAISTPIAGLPQTPPMGLWCDPRALRM